MFNLSWFFVSDGVVELSDQVNLQRAALATHIAGLAVPDKHPRQVAYGVRVGESVSAAFNIEYTAAGAKVPNGNRRRASSATENSRGSHRRAKRASRIVSGFSPPPSFEQRGR